MKAELWGLCFGMFSVKAVLIGNSVFLLFCNETLRYRDVLILITSRLNHLKHIGNYMYHLL